MPADQVEEITDAAREEGLTPTEFTRRVMLTIARSAHLRAAYHAVPQGILHPDRAVALRLAEER